MPSDTHPTMDLPPYRAVLVVDCEKFNGNPSRNQPEVTSAIPQVLRETLSRCGLDEIWPASRYRQHIGDGYVLGTEPHRLPWLIDPFLRQLQLVLAEHDRTLRTIDRGLRLRLRVSIHIGPLPDEGTRGATAGCGRPMNDAHRLLDSTVVRTALASSDPDVTFVAALLSQRVYEDVVLAGYTSMQPTEFTPHLVRVKEFRQRAWLFVPKPSTNVVGDRPAPHRNRPRFGSRPSPAWGRGRGYIDVRRPAS